MTEQTEPEVTRLRRLTAEAAARTPNLVAELSATIKRAAGPETDPYIVMGLLIEGVSDTLATRIPPMRPEDVAQARAHMLLDRMKVYRTLQPTPSRAGDRSAG